MTAILLVICVESRPLLFPAKKRNKQKGRYKSMANPKTLGPNPRPNARPLASVNQRPVQTPQRGMTLGQRPQAGTNSRPMQQRQAPQQAVSSSQTAKTMPGSAQAIRQGAPVQKRMGTGVPSQKRTDAAGAFVDMLREMVGGFAILSENVLQKNMKLMSGEGLSYEDRTVSFECADYVISNLAYIFMGLVLDSNFKESFMDALNVELQIDSMPANQREQVRKQMKDLKQYQSKGSIVLGVTTFVPPIADNLTRKMQEGFSKLDAYADEFDAEVAKMPNENKVELGFIFSNFMYLIRAFTHNDMFMSYVITVIEKVKGITSGKQG